MRFIGVLVAVGSAGGIIGGSVGSSLLGYLSASLDPSTGKILIGHAYGGSIHTWHLDDTKLKEKMPDEPGILSTEDRAVMVSWRAKSGITGHFASVTDLCWEAERGSYVLSVGQDQTCRLWACADTAWLELGRPQVHGYDLTSVVSLSTSTHPHLIVTGADEKEIRAFDAPKVTLQLLNQVAGIELLSSDSVKRVDRAYIPSLGLSNKSTAVDAAEEEGPAEKTLVSTYGKVCPLPMERDLGSVSLWPEIVKLFGHNTELYCLASTLAARTCQEFSDTRPSDVLVSSACKARDVESASIRLWNVHKGTCHQVLSGGHKATVATMAFSPCGNYLASSGKDRRLCLWKKDISTNLFGLAWAQESAHKRIVWSVHFCPWNSECLVSGSRDGCIKIWQVAENPVQSETIARVLYSFSPISSINGKPDSVTALSVRPKPLEDGTALLAVGLESGRLEFWSIPTVESLDSKPSLSCLMPLSMCHKAACTKLAWQPQRLGPVESSLLASSSMDHGIRIFEVQ
jgi:elongator complex protein 2